MMADPINPTMIRLGDFNIPPRTIVLIPETGIISTEIFKKDLIYHGEAVLGIKFIHKYRFVAFYVLSSKLFLQVDTRRWDLDDPSIKVKSTPICPGLRKFEVTRNSLVEFREIYIDRFFMLMYPPNLIGYMTDYPYSDMGDYDFFFRVSNTAKSSENRELEKSFWPHCPATFNQRDSGGQRGSSD